MDTFEDTIDDEYLAQREIAHELNSPAAQMLREYMASEKPGSPAPAGSEGPPPKPKEPKPVGQEDLMTEEESAAVSVEETRRQDAEQLVDPLLDPTTAFFAGGAGGVGSSILRKGGNKLFPILGKFLASGSVSAMAEYPIGAAAEAISGGDERIGIPAAVAMSVLSGATFEAIAIRAIEKQLAKAGAKRAATVAGKAKPEEALELLGPDDIIKEETKKSKVVEKAVRNYKNGKEDEFTESIMREMRSAYDEESVKSVAKAKTDPLVSISDEDAAQFLAADASYDLGKYGQLGGNLNFDKIDSPEQVKEMIEKTTKVFKKQVEHIKGHTLGREAVERLSADLGMTPEELLKTTPYDETMIAEAHAARKMLVSSAVRLHELTQRVASRTANDIDKLKWQKQLTVHSAIYEHVTGRAAFAGRLLQSHSIPVNESPVIMNQLNELSDAAVVIQKNISNQGVSDLMARVASIKESVC